MIKSLKYIALLIILPGFMLSAQEEPEEGSILDTLVINTDIFEADEPLVFTMKFDIRAFQRTKYKGEYMPAELTYHLNDTFSIEKNIRLKARGNFRRSHCSMPPFWLNIRKAGIKNIHLRDTKRMKVVTHCNGGKASDIYVMKEFLAYKIYNLLSPYSFRARLIRMKYIDTGRKNRVKENWAFIIEDEQMLAERLNAIPVKYDKLSMQHMLTEHMDRVAMFQYMIGNADYSITGRQNVKLLSENKLGVEGLIPVPYDFDYSGLVDASYAVPGETLGIESVTERYYLGACRDEEVYQVTLDFFNRHRDEIIALINDFPYLDKREKNDLISYIQLFYTISSYRGFITNEIKSTCR